MSHLVSLHENLSVCEAYYCAYSNFKVTSLLRIANTAHKIYAVEILIVDKYAQSEHILFACLCTTTWSAESEERNRAHSSFEHVCSTLTLNLVFIQFIILSALLVWMCGVWTMHFYRMVIEINKKYIMWFLFICIRVKIFLHSSQCT